MNVIDTQLQNYHIPILGPFILITYRKDILFSFLYTDMSQQVSFLHLFLKFQTEIQFPHWHHSMESSFEKWLYSALLDAPALLLLFSHLTLFQLFVTPWIAVHQAFLSSLSPRVCSNSCPLNW